MSQESTSKAGLLLQMAAAAVYSLKWLQFDKDSGKVPLRYVCDTKNSLRSVKPPITSGRVPVNWLYEISNRSMTNKERKE